MRNIYKVPIIHSCLFGINFVTSEKTNNDRIAEMIKIAIPPDTFALVRLSSADIFCMRDNAVLSLSTVSSLIIFWKDGDSTTYKTKL